MTPTAPGPSWGLCPQTPVVLGCLVQWGSEGRAPCVYFLGLFSVVCVLVSLYFLRTEIQIAVTRCHILRLKCTKIDFFWGFAPL